MANRKYGRRWAWRFAEAAPAMRMLRFRVVGFRSVQDSGWIEVDDVTALIGENESGKTNLLIPLWKLNPASSDGAINLFDDFPRDRYHEAYAMPKEDLPVFIQADFAVSPRLASEIAELTGATPEEVSVARVARSYNGNYTIGFPEAHGADKISGKVLGDALKVAQQRVETAEAAKPTYMSVRDAICTKLDSISDEVATVEALSETQLKSARDQIEATRSSRISPTSDLARSLDAVLADVDELIARSQKEHPSKNEEAMQRVRDEMPRFVYYSTYGNLDSEIYLPHVIDNMARIARGEKLGTRDTAKSRTLKVLFDFVRLKPKEIQSLGKPPASQQGHAPTMEEVEEAAQRTKEREVLLSSASNELTTKFREWWKQGQHRFRFQADGDHFRIWVSDDKRLQEVELEARSSGLQWFFSFFLVFLAERTDEHKDAILLLDEPGVSLHPLAQRDLSHFFESLAVENQLLYTSHSPFLLDYDRLDQVKVVYVLDNGFTAISANLRAAEKDPARTKSIYAVHAALGLSVSETLFIGGAPVIVEGTIDQIYLGLAKIALIKDGRITPPREIVFVPAGGAKGITTVASIVAFADDLPPVILDCDGPGQAARKSLEQGLYKAHQDRIFTTDRYATVEGSEIEDLMPGEVLASVATRLYQTEEEDFSDIYESTKPILPQIEAFVAKHSIALTKSWKIDLAKSFADRVRRKPSLIDAATIDTWETLFKALIPKIDPARATPTVIEIS